ncbi:MAG: hypothetical protein OXU20_12960 [Myxococcales bacterium]|nr:hypothetical protein [Myxococcales bacterium]
MASPNAGQVSTVRSEERGRRPLARTVIRTEGLDHAFHFGIEPGLVGEVRRDPRTHFVALGPFVAVEQVAVEVERDDCECLLAPLFEQLALFLKGLFDLEQLDAKIRA